jgi:CspA family cold shock protein
MSEGVVKWFNSSKGFGFIKMEDREVFVHYSDLMVEGFKTISEGEKVLFDLYEDKKGFVAKNVRREKDGKR